MIRQKRFRMMKGLRTDGEKTLLPEAYQQLEYLEGGDGSYINTGVTYCQNTVYADVAFPYGNAFAVGVAVYGQKSTKSFAIKRSYNYNSCIQIENRNEDIWHRTVLLDRRVKLLYNTAEGKLFVDGEEVSPRNPMDGGAPTGIPMFLFAENFSGSPDFPGQKVRIHRITIWDRLSRTPQRDYIPCCRKADGEPGMFDLVSGTFFVNAGSGTFERGAEL